MEAEDSALATSPGILDRNKRLTVNFKLPGPALRRLAFPAFHWSPVKGSNNLIGSPFRFLYPFKDLGGALLTRSCSA